MRKRWTPEEVEALKRMRETSTPIREISYTLGKSANAVTKRLEREALEKEKPVDPRLIVRNLWADGKPAEYIAQLINKTPEDVSKMLERMGFVLKRPPMRVNWDVVLTRRLIDLTKLGLSMGQIAKQLGISRNAVIGRSNRLKLSQHRPKDIPRNQPPVSKKLKAKVKDKVISGFIKSIPIEKPINVRKPNGFLGLGLQDLECGECRYPYGGDNGIPITFCGQPVKPGSSYCPECHAICWTPPRRTGA